MTGDRLPGRLTTRRDRRSPCCRLIFFKREIKILFMILSLYRETRALNCIAGMIAYQY